MKAAFVAVVGRPSAGKSTLVNQICGEKVSIVSGVPQTTRNAIRGIINREQGQLVFVDTPGRHKSDKKFNKKLMDVSQRALNDSDLVLYVIDAARPPGEEETALALLLAPRAGRTVAALNKTDLPGADCARAADFLAGHLPAVAADRCFKISAKNNQGIEPVLAALFDMAPEGEPFYGGEYYTDQEVDFRIAEIIREQAILRLRQELPHALYVQVADTEFKSGEKPHAPETDTVRDDLPVAGQPRLWVRAFIIVERESQKGMVVGKGGEMIKAIRQASQKELSAIFDWKIELDLRVKTGKDWRSNDSALRRIIG
jgi:GTP-binding protein Era